ncbi:MAG TPA: M1 family metallopeptidase [Chitinophagaceae bacterium]|nr:M1 family metallopeptidase [Chitinophagaceae bacterium]
MRFFVFALACTLLAQVSFSQPLHNPGSNHGNRFEQLDYLLQTPNEYRTASGAPGPKYWQQRADYDITVDIDEAKNMLTGAETVTYHNNSPDVLKYIWLQLDENFHKKMTESNRIGTGTMPDRVSEPYIAGLENARLEGLGVNITSLTDATGKKLEYTINQTMMRLDLPVPLKPGQKFVFNVKWNYKINEKSRGDRGGYEHFEDDDNNLYSITQWFPRLAVYSDFQGWQTLQFTGGSEFALTFGNYKVKITVPADHVVASTGECKNYSAVLTPTQLARYQKAQTAKEPVEIITLQEALENSKTKKTGKKTWIFEALNVRDFAFNTSRRLVWDALATTIDGKKIMCMSFYGKEAYPIYSKYSTKVVEHTLKVYSRISIPYPYPVAQSVEANIGMEYPMLAMNFGRADKNGNYSAATRNGAIGVIIHEVGHNFFPMIVNGDERQWWWMDEGLNSFCQYIAEQELEPGFPSRRGPAYTVTDYMNLPKDRLEPIMTKGDYVANVGSNAYAKAAAGLNILRETILGKELFDFSFREYARRWAFKHPTPADLFRTMEDASGSDLDWFWRGWYFGTDAVDISLDSVRWAKSDSLLNGKEVNLYELRFSNKGGMVMPVIIEWTYKDGTKEIETVPVTVWGKNENAFTKVFKKEKEVSGIVIDPKKETADINLSNGSWPVKEMPTKFQIYKGWSRGS